MLLEGGYNVDAIGPCALAVLRGLAKRLDDWSPDQPTEKERSHIEAAARIQEGVLDRAVPGTVLAARTLDGKANKHGGV